MAPGRWHYDRYVTLHNTKRPKLQNYKTGHSYIKRQQDRFPSPLWLEFQMSAAAKVHVGPLNRVAVRTGNSNTPIWQHLKPLHAGCFFYFFLNSSGYFAGRETADGADRMQNFQKSNVFICRMEVDYLQTRNDHDGCAGQMSHLSRTTTTLTTMADKLANCVSQHRVLFDKELQIKLYQLRHRPWCRDETPPLLFPGKADENTSIFPPFWTVLSKLYRHFVLCSKFLSSPV